MLRSVDSGSELAQEVGRRGLVTVGAIVVVAAIVAIVVVIGVVLTAV